MKYMNVRRINLFGGPGCGKSTIAAYFFAKLKIDNINIELVTEVAKSYAYKKIPIVNETQLQVFSQQMSREILPLENGEDHIITDSPLWLQYYYATEYAPEYKEVIYNLCKVMDEKYRSINIFVHNDYKNFSNVGRFEDRATAKSKQNDIYKIISEKLKLDCEVWPYNDLINDSNVYDEIKNSLLV